MKTEIMNRVSTDYWHKENEITDSIKRTILETLITNILKTIPLENLLAGSFVVTSTIIDKNTKKEEKVNEWRRCIAERLVYFEVVILFSKT